MSILEKLVSAQKIWTDEGCLWVTLSDDRQLATPLSYFPRLLNASKVQRKIFEVRGGGRGIHREELDEEISAEDSITGSRRSDKSSLE